MLMMLVAIARGEYKNPGARRAKGSGIFIEGGVEIKRVGRVFVGGDLQCSNATKT